MAASLVTAYNLYTTIAVKEGSAAISVIGAWAMILLLSGEEKNTLYRSEAGGLRKAGEVTLTRGSILPMLAETAHVAECIGDRPAIGLHVYGGKVTRRNALPVMLGML